MITSVLSRRSTWTFLSIGPSRTSLSTEISRPDAVKPTGDVSVQKSAAERNAKSRPKSSRPGSSRSEEIADAAAKVTSGKSSWQRFVGGAVDALRPLTAAAGPIVMPVLDAPSKRRVRSAVNIDDLRVAAERRAHAMVYGYLAGGADDERALRRSVDAFNDVELRHAVLHGVGNDDLDLSTSESLWIHFPRVDRGLLLGR
jgi:hypothetical protein